MPDMRRRTQITHRDGRIVPAGSRDLAKPSIYGPLGPARRCATIFGDPKYVSNIVTPLSLATGSQLNRSAGGVRTYGDNKRLETEPLRSKQPEFYEGSPADSPLLNLPIRHEL